MKVSCIVLVCGKVCGLEGLIGMIYQLREQTYKDIEIIPVTCCTPYLDVVERLFGVRSEVLNHCGSFEKCNKGIELATGEYIGFFAGDDLYEHDYIEHMALQGYDLIYCDFYSHYRQDGSVCDGKLEMGHITTGSFLIKTDIAKKHTFPITGTGDIEFIQKVIAEPINTVYVQEALYIHR